MRLSCSAVIRSAADLAAKMRATAVIGAATLTLVVTCGSPANATIIWDWSFGTEAGQFVTDGNLVGNFAPPDRYTVSDFILLQSSFVPLGSISGGQFDEGTQPGTGFDWDGSAPTLFFRAGGALTNGANYFSNLSASFHGFGPTQAIVVSFEGDEGDETLVSGPLTLAPVAVAVPEPSSGVLLLVGGAVAGLARRMIRATRRPKLRVG